MFKRLMEAQARHNEKYNGALVAEYKARAKAEGLGFTERMKAADAARKGESYPDFGVVGEWAAVKRDAAARFYDVCVLGDEIVRYHGPDKPVERRSLAGAVATVERDGAVSARATLTRSALVRGWQKGLDDRMAHMIVEGADFYWTVFVPHNINGKFDAVKEAEARDFASIVTHEGRRAAR